MARKRRNNRSRWTALPMWAGIFALAGWGIWQAAVFRRSVLAEVRAAAREDQRAAAPADPPPPPASATAASPIMIDPAADIVPEIGSDEWGTPAANAPASRKAAAEVIPAAAPLDAAALSSANQLIARGSTLLDQGHIVAGRTALNAALAILKDDPRAGRLRAELTALNAGVFLGSAVLVDDPAARFVDIQPGDSFLKLGRTYSIPAALLEAMNPGVNPRNLKPLTGLKIVQGPFHVKMFKQAQRIDLYARDLYVRSFPAITEDGNYLPVGEYRVSRGEKIQLGARAWIGFQGIDANTRDVTDAWLYGAAGPRQTRGEDRISGVKLQDTDLWQLYNVLVENRSLLHVEP